MDRVVAYIDGFNLYFGMKDSGFKRYYWLNVKALITTFLRPNQQLEHVKYFTAKIGRPFDKAQRQQNYLQALETLSNTTIYYGRYIQDKRTCPNCGSDYFANSEKMTDVNIAVEMMVDAQQDNFDTAILISGDSDLTGPVKAVRNLFQKNVLVLFPPKRYSHDLSTHASAYINIGEARLKKSVFPRDISLPKGKVISCPTRWLNIAPPK